MKKIILAVVLCFGMIGFTQAQSTDTANTATSNQGFKEGKAKEGMFKKLQNVNLTPDQKKKLVEYKKSAKEKEDAINNNKNLTPEQRNAQLMELRKQTKKNIISILTPEQKQKLMEERKGKK